MEHIINDTEALPARIRTYLESARIPVAVSAIAKDTPLIFVNDRFCDLTGYSRDEVLGRNCRFLQGAETTDESRQALRAYIHDPTRDAGRFPIVNYRKNGTRFENFVFMTRLRSRSKITRFILASQLDLTTTMRRANTIANDKSLTMALSDLDQMSKETGLVMINSAQAISDSVAIMARMSLDDDLY